MENIKLKGITRKAQNLLKGEGKKKKAYGDNGIKQQWKDYNLNNPDDKVTFVDFRAVIKAYNKKITERVVEGQKFKLYGLGDLFVQKINRNFNRRVIDWEASIKLKKPVFQTSEFYLMIRWRKHKHKSKHTFYKLIPCRGKNSFVSNLYKKLKLPFQHLKYVSNTWGKYIEQYSMSGTLLGTYLSFSEIKTKYPDIFPSTIKNVANNPSRSAYGYRWNIIT